MMASCNYKVVHQHPDSVSPSQLTDFSLPPEQISFAMVMRNVIGPKCVTCHSADGGNRGGINLKTFANVQRHRSAIKSAIEDGSMPQDGSLTEIEKKFVIDWIDAGTSELGGPANAPSSNPDAPARPVSPVTPGTGPVPPTPAGPGGLNLDFATVQAKVFKVSCDRCHSAPTNSGGVNLETYLEVKKNLSDIKSDIEDGSMPKKGTLTPDQKTLLLDWIIAGGPEKVTDVPAPAPVQPPPVPTGPLTPDEEIVARGKYLFGLSNCAACHTLDPAKPLAGGKAIGSGYGTFYAPNISAAKRTGIGRWLLVGE